MRTDGDLRKLFREHLPKIHWQSVETGGTGRGIPDSNGCGLTTDANNSVVGIEFWIEFKVTAAWAVALRPEQVGWLTQRARHGGRVFVAVRRTSKGGPRSGPPSDELWLLDGQYARDIKQDGLRKLPAGSLLSRSTGGPAQWDWQKIETAILGEKSADQFS